MKKCVRLCVVAAASAAVLTACGGQQGQAGVQELSERVAELEQEVAELQGAQELLAGQVAGIQQIPQQEQAAEAGSTDVQADIPADMAAAAEEKASGQQASAGQASAGQETKGSGAPSVSKAEIDKLSGEVDAAVKAADAQTPAGTNEERMKQFMDAKSALKAVGNTVDAYDDVLERDYKAGSMTREAYLPLEQQLDALDEALDQAEDRLELRFGIDD